jgi:hypothetical protein
MGSRETSDIDVRVSSVIDTVATRREAEAGFDDQLSTLDGAALMDAFRLIKSPKVRRHVVAMVRAISDDAKAA